MRRFLVVAAALLVVAVCVLPLLLVLKQAFSPDQESFAWPPTWVPRALTLENFRRVGEAGEVGRGFFLSVAVGVATVVATLALAVPAAWLAAREPGLGRRLDAVMTLVRCFPSIALAVPLAVLFVRLGLYNDRHATGLWLAHTLIGLPFAFFVIRAAFRAVPRELEEAARLDGARPLVLFLHVSLPLVRPSLATASLLAFLLSWDEFGYALLLQVTNRTLPPLLFYLAAFGFPGLSSALAAIMLVPALVIVFLLEPALRSGVLAGSGR